MRDDSRQVIAETVVPFDVGTETVLGILHAPTCGARRQGVIIVVGGPQYRVGSHRMFVSLARAMARAGYHVLRWDVRGMGDSSGRAAPYDQVDEDIRCAVSAMSGAVRGLTGIWLLGLCDGASAAMLYCARDPTVSGLIALNPWVRSETGQARALVRHYFWRRLVQRSFWSKVRSGEFRAFQAFRGFFVSIRTSLQDRGGAANSGSVIERMLASVRCFRGRVIIILSGRDLTAREFEDLCASSERWKAWKGRRSVDWLALPSADHTFSGQGSLAVACRLIIDTMRKTRTDAHLH